MTRARATLLLIGLFLLGVACGAFGMAAFRIHHRGREGFSPDRMEKFVVRRLSHRLELDEAQRQVLQETTHKALGRIEQVRDEAMPRVEAILNEAFEELKPVLRPDQAKELERVRSEALERLRRHHS